MRFRSGRKNIIEERWENWCCQFTPQCKCKAQGTSNSTNFLWVRTGFNNWCYFLQICEWAQNSAKLKRNDVSERIEEESYAAMQMEELKKASVKALPDLSSPRLHSSSATAQDNDVSVFLSENYANPNAKNTIDRGSNFGHTRVCSLIFLS